MSAQADWMAHNRAYLRASFDWTRVLLEALNEHPAMPAPELAQTSRVIAARAVLDVVDTDAFEPALLTLVRMFGLSDAARSAIALCLAVELDSAQASLCRQLQGGAQRWVSFALLSALFEDSSWELMLPGAPLRYWRLLTVEQRPGESVLDADLRLDERILGFLNGINGIDRCFADLLGPPMPSLNSVAGAMPGSHRVQAEQMSGVVRASMASSGRAVLRLAGENPANKHAVVSEIALDAEITVYQLHSALLPAPGDALGDFARRWLRETQLSPLALYLRHDGDSSAAMRLHQLLSAAPGLYFIDSNEGLRGLREDLVLEITNPTRSEQRQAWNAQPEPEARALSAEIAEQFSFDLRTIERIASIRSGPGEENVSRPAVWEACRQAARGELDHLAHRVQPRANLETLILPADTLALILGILNQVRHRKTVYEDWGYRDKLSRGLGVSALFSGPSGTGKTMAAEAIANELELDLYRIDLSGVVSKYIGETEKNLARIFAAAENCGAILFFDEADAIFGKRTEVKDSHDRYANLEVAYLLQRMENYSGLAILASNFRKALDRAFIRRLRYIVDFELPSRAERERIWQHVFPDTLPLAHDFDPVHLSSLQVTGGSIQNIAMQASFMAASARGVVDMPTILSAARQEFGKLRLPAKSSLFEWQASPVRKASAL